MFLIKTMIIFVQTTQQQKEFFHFKEQTIWTMNFHEKWMHFTLKLCWKIFCFKCTNIFLYKLLACKVFHIIIPIEMLANNWRCKAIMFWVLFRLFYLLNEYQLELLMDNLKCYVFMVINMCMTYHQRHVFQLAMFCVLINVWVAFKMLFKPYHYS